MEYGYETVFWYREGTDGWNKAALPTALAHPFKP
jgi:rhodanese-related sulfurtransferase